MTTAGFVSNGLMLQTFGITMLYLDADPALLTSGVYTEPGVYCSCICLLVSRIRDLVCARNDDCDCELSNVGREVLGGLPVLGVAASILRSGEGLGGTCCDWLEGVKANVKRGIGMSPGCAAISWIEVEPVTADGAHSCELDGV